MLKSESFYIEAEFCNTHYNTNAGEESCSSDCCDQEWISIDAVEIERSVQDDFQIQLPPFDFKVIDFSALLHRFSEFEHLPSLPENLLLTRPALAQLQCYLI